MAPTITFQVIGTPRPGGSKTGFYNKKLARVMMVDASGQKGKDWRTSVQAAAMEAYDGPLLQGAVRLYLHFLFSRPKSHYGTGRNASRLKPSAPQYHTQKPDLTKIVRSVEDALAGIVWKDDSQVTAGSPSKSWIGGADRSGVYVTITPLEERDTHADARGDDG